MIHFALASALALASNLIPIRDGPQWNGIDPATRDWFRSLRNPNTSIPCCDVTDGTRLDDPEYRENPDGSYEVFIFGEWRHVDKSQVINPKDRKVEYGIIWWAPGLDHPYCFMPGAGG